MSGHDEQCCCKSCLAETPTQQSAGLVERPWDTNAEPFRAMFNAALTGILANPAFFGPLFQGEPQAAVAFADSIVVAATTPKAGAPT